MSADTPPTSDMPPAINLNGTMVDSVNRQTLYTYDGDTHNHSNCTDEACIAQWLPFYAREHHVAVVISAYSRARMAANNGH